MVGTMKTLAKDPGLGFIRADEGQDYFFHLTELVGGLTFTQLKKDDALSRSREGTTSG